MNTLKPYLWRMICTALGLISAILFLTLGAAKTVLILLCCGAGFAAGIIADTGFALPTFKTEALKPFLGRIACIALGLASAASFLTLGAAKTALILFCCGISYAVGVCHDKKIDLPKQLFFWRNKF